MPRLVPAHPEVPILYFPVLSMAPQAGQSPWAGLIPVLIMVAIFYLLLIAPMRKRQKQHEAMLGGLKHGDRVVTNGGVFGTVVGIEEDRVRLKIADQVKIEVQKQAISSLVEEDR